MYFVQTEELNQSFVADYIREQLARLHLSRELVESLPAAVDIPLKSEALVTNVAKTDVDAPLAESDAGILVVCAYIDLCAHWNEDVVLMLLLILCCTVK